MNHHPITVAAPRSLAQAGAPYLLQRDDDDFVSAMLAELGSSEGHARLAATRATVRDTEKQALKLYQPVQRRFHVALVEAWCDTAGNPRIDPARVDAAGLVLRRLRRNGTVEGWMRSSGVARGWMSVDRIGGDKADPLPIMRLALKDTGVAQIDKALRQLDATSEQSTLQEDVVPMFLAPPDVCTKSGQTVYYGVVPTASGELAQVEPDTDALFEDFGPQSEAFRRHLVQPLAGLQAFTFPTPPLPDRRFDRTWFRSLQDSAPLTSEQRFMLLLQQVAIEFDAFGDTPTASALQAQLAQIRLPYALRSGETSQRSTDAATFLREAVRVLLADGEGTVEMPLSWPALGADVRQRLSAAMSNAMLARFRSVKGRPGRYDEPDAKYVLRAFVRLKPEGNCPARTVWSDYTEPFVIAPWYEGAGDPVQIVLPDLSKRELLKQLKPNVAFTLPPSLQNLLCGDAKKLLDGEKGNCGFEVGWICSFSIPVITFCAFIVLNIFLSLFDLFFRWMLFIKICIPYPKAK